MWTIVVILFILWLLGAFGSRIHSGIPNTGNAVHVLIVIVVVLVVLNLLGVL